MSAKKPLCIKFTPVAFFPGFSELTLNDQMRLLQRSWPEILTLGLCFRSQASKSATSLNLAADFSLSEQEAKDCGLTEFFNHVSSLNFFTFTYIHI
jgi:estrogen-related receptor ERR